MIDELSKDQKLGLIRLKSKMRENVSALVRNYDNVCKDLLLEEDSANLNVNHEYITLDDQIWYFKEFLQIMTGFWEDWQSDTMSVDICNFYNNLYVINKPWYNLVEYLINSAILDVREELLTIDKDLAKYYSRIQGL